MDDERVTLSRLPTASFTLTASLLAWIEAESERRQIKKSALVREVLTAAKVHGEADSADEREAVTT